MDPAGPVPAGLVLAGGASRRMPGPSKLTRAWADTTVLGAVVAAARAAGLAPVVVVDREPGIEFGDVTADRRIAIAPGGGRGDSLAAGLRALERGPVVVLLGDEPGIRPEVVRRLVEHCESAGADAGRVQYDDRPGHPVWLGPAARAVAQELAGEPPVWKVLEAAGLRLIGLRVPGPAPIDVDSPDDLARARRRAGRR